MDMRERMARAICRADRYNEDHSWETYVPHADAVLEVLREPDEGMLEAGRYGINGEPDSHADTEEAARDCWQAMIDHISKPGEPAGDVREGDWVPDGFVKVEDGGTAG